MSGTYSVGGCSSLTTPSQLWSQASKQLLTANGVSHPDDLFQEALYAISVLEDPDFGDIEDDPNILGWLWQQLNSATTATVSSKERTKSDIPPPSSSSCGYYEWWAGLQLLSNLAKQMTPFDLHGSVVEAMDYCMDADQVSSTFVCLCLLLCTFALKQRPQSKQQLTSETIRWKRWQSLVCETIRLYQRYALPRFFDDISSSTTSSSSTSSTTITRDALWMDHVLPACRHVVKVLPTDTGLPQVALMAGMIGTSTHLLVKHDFSSCQFAKHPDDESLSSSQHQKRRQQRKVCERTILNFIKAIGPVMGYRYERWVWCHPWRVYCESYYDGPDNDHIQWLARKSDIGWWTEHAGNREQTAGMNTSWNTVGLACLAVFGFDYRPLVLSQNHIWSLWFPHVAILLESTLPNATDEEEDDLDEDDENNDNLDDDDDYDNDYHQPAKRRKRQQFSMAFRTDIAMLLLEKLIKVTPERSLVLFDSGRIKRKDALKRRRPDHPIGTFQLMSNLVVAETSSSSQQQRRQSQQVLDHEVSMQKKVMTLMNSVLTLYEPAHQVYIIDELIQNCPHQGFECKLFDMLRPLVSRSDTPDVLWKYLDKVVDDISDHVVEAGEKCQLIEVETLIDKVEIYVSLMTMLQLWLMVHFESPRVDMSILFSFNRALKASLQRWSNTTEAMPPDDYYRLYLLDSVLEQVLQLEESVQSKQNTPMMGPAPPPPPAPFLEPTTPPTAATTASMVMMGPEPPSLNRVETPTSLGYRVQTPTTAVVARSPPRNWSNNNNNNNNNSSSRTPSARSSRSSTPTMFSTPTMSFRTPPKNSSPQHLNPSSRNNNNSSSSSNLMAPSLLHESNHSSFASLGASHGDLRRTTSGSAAAAHSSRRYSSRRRSTEATASNSPKSYGVDPSNRSSRSA